MTETSRFWDGVSVGDAVTAPYSSDEYARVQYDLLHATIADSGPLLGSGVNADLGLTVRATTPASANVEVTIGSALVRGTWYHTDATVTLPVTANASGSARVDTVVLRKDYAAQTIRLAVLPGTPAGSPVPPALTQTAGVTWEIPLADIAVANGFATLAQTTITPRRHWANVGDGVYLEGVLNNSGATLETGDVVIWDTTADKAVTTSVTLGDPLLAGVWVGRTAAGGYGRVQTKGIGLVRIAGQVLSRGLTLVKSNTAKAAQSASTAATASKRNAVGLSLEIVAAASYLCWTAIDIGAFRYGAIVQNIFTAGNSSKTNTNFVDAHASMNVTITPHSDRVKVTMMFTARAGAAGGCYDIYSVGLTARAGDATLGLALLVNESSGDAITITGYFTGLATGVAQEFRLQVQTLNGAQPVLVDAPFTAYAEEL